MTLYDIKPTLFPYFWKIHAIRTETVRTAARTTLSRHWDKFAELIYIIKCRFPMYGTSFAGTCVASAESSVTSRRICSSSKHSLMAALSSVIVRCRCDSHVKFAPTANTQDLLTYVLSYRICTVYPNVKLPAIKHLYSFSQMIPPIVLSCWIL